MSIFIKDALVYYKNQPAIITNIDKKIDITLLDGSVKKVRDKDISFIHKGPIKSLNALSNIEVDPQEAWSLLEGEEFSLEDLSEFLFGDNSINSIYNSFLVLQEDLYFTGSRESISCKSIEDINSVLDKEKEKREREESFNSSIERLKKGTWCEDDIPVLKEVEELALDQRNQSKVLKILGIKENPISAHRYLLKIKYWQRSFDTTPGRFHLSLISNQKVSDYLEVENPMDLTHLDTYAIDDEGSKDPDDAISLEGDNRLWVHITDVASIIKPGMPEDIEASSKGSNLYLPFKTVHMLPEEITELQGLGIRDVNNTLSFLFEFDSEYNITKREIHLARVRVKRTSYSQVEDNRDDEPFLRFYRIGQALKERRLNNGAISISLPEVKIRVEEDDISIKEIGLIESRNFVSEFMMLAGESAAIFARDNGIPIPYATQLPPDAKGKPEDNLSSMYLWRRKFKRGETKFSPESHAGLGLELYTRATSPLRRYSDLVVNQQIRAYLQGEPTLSQEEILMKIMPGIESSKKLAICERTSNLHWKLVYLERNRDKVFKGIYVEKKDKGRGAFLINELAMDVLVPLKDDLEINSQVDLRVKNIDIPEAEVLFTLC